MLTFSKVKGAQRVAVLYMDKKKRKGGKPIFFLDKKIEQHRNVIEDPESYLEQPSFREKYDLSSRDIEALVPALIHEKIPEDSKLRKKYFLVSKELERRSYKEIDMSDNPNAFITIDLPEKIDEYPYSMSITAASGLGKTYWLKELLMRHFEQNKGKRKQKRNVVYISAELSLDKTLKELRENQKLRNYFTGVDVSQTAYDQWKEMNNGGNVQEFFEKRVKAVVDNAPRNSIICADDVRDGAYGLQNLMLRYMNKGLRTARHENKSWIIISHQIAGGSWTRQIANSVRYRVLFAKSVKSKLINYFKSEGWTLRDTREIIARFSESGRQMISRIHAPNLIIGDKLIMLV